MINGKEIIDNIYRLIVLYNREYHDKPNTVTISKGLIDILKAESYEINTYNESENDYVFGLKVIPNFTDCNRIEVMKNIKYKANTLEELKKDKEGKVFEMTI